MAGRFCQKTAMRKPAAKAPLPPGRPVVATSSPVGLLLVNLGTPDATDYWSMRRYLKEFLSDRRVIESNRLLWWVILNGIVLTTRPRRSGHAYDRIWNSERNESPLKTITREQAAKLSQRLGDGIRVDWAMRYGSPTVAERLKAMKQDGCERIVVFPLYPQYSAATTASVMDALGWALEEMRWQPAIRVVPPYFSSREYVDAISASLKEHLKSLEWKPDRILMAFHGLPKAYIDKGDPYLAQCQATARLVREQLQLAPEALQVVFQSRFGRAEWLKPYVQETVEGLPAQGVRKLLVISPGFAADCVETLEELAIGLKEMFHARGGQEFSVVPCLNDSPRSINMLSTIAGRELGGWI